MPPCPPSLRPWRGGKIFVFIVCLKHFFWAQQTVWWLCLRGYGPEGSFGDQSIKKGIVRNDEIVSTLPTLLKQEPWISRIFSLLCNEMVSKHQSLLFHISVRWVSRGKVLARLFELRHEISQVVLSQNNHHLYKHLKMIVGLLNVHIWPTCLNSWLNSTLKWKYTDVLKGINKQKLVLWKTELTWGTGQSRRHGGLLGAYPP